MRLRPGFTLRGLSGRRRLFLAVGICAVAGGISIGAGGCGRSGGSKEEPQQAAGPAPAAQAAAPPSREAERPQPDPVKEARAEIAAPRGGDRGGKESCPGLSGTHGRHRFAGHGLQSLQRARPGHAVLGTGGRPNPKRADLFQAMATVALQSGDNEKAAVLCRRGLERFGQGCFPALHFGGSLDRLGRSRGGRPRTATGDRAFLPTTARAITCWARPITCWKTGSRPGAATKWPWAAARQPDCALRAGQRVRDALGRDDQSAQSMEEYRKLQAESMDEQRRKRGVAYDVAAYRNIVSTTCREAATDYAGDKNNKAEQLLRRGAKADPADTACRINLVLVLWRGRACRRQSGQQGTDRDRAQQRQALPGLGQDLRQLHASTRRWWRPRRRWRLARDDRDCRRLLDQLEGRKWGTTACTKKRKEKTGRFDRKMQEQKNGRRKREKGIVEFHFSAPHFSVENLPFPNFPFRIFFSPSSCRTFSCLPFFWLPPPKPSARSSFAT